MYAISIFGMFVLFVLGQGDFLVGIEVLLKYGFTLMVFVLFFGGLITLIITPYQIVKHKNKTRIT